MARIEVDPQRCDACSSCVEACPMEVFVLEDRTAEPVRASDCMLCRLCEVECPNQAIRVEE